MQDLIHPEIAKHKLSPSVKKALNEHFLPRLTEGDKAYFFEWIPEIVTPVTRAIDIKRFGQLLHEFSPEDKALRMLHQFPPLASLRLKAAGWQLIKETLPLMAEGTRHIFLSEFSNAWEKNPERINEKITWLKKRLEKARQKWPHPTDFRRSCENAVRRFGKR